MLPLALCEVDECKLYVSVHIPLNVAKLTGPHNQLQMEKEAEYTKNILFLHILSFHYFPSPPFPLCPWPTQTLFAC